MNIRVLALGSGLLVALAVVAFGVNQWIGSSGTADRVGSVLQSDVNPADARKVEIVSQDKTVTLTTEDGVVWRVSEQLGFPVDSRKIKDLFYNLGNQKVAHLVTRNADSLGALGLLTKEENGGQWETGKTARLLHIYTNGQAPAFTLLIGNDRRGADGSSFGGTYIRFSGDTAAYLVGESILREYAPQGWIDNKVLDLDADQTIRSVTVIRQGRRDVRLTREQPGGSWSLAGMSASQLNSDEVTAVTAQLAGLDIFKVRSPSEPRSSLGREKTGRVEFELFDKRKFTLEIGEAKADDEFRYVAMEASLPADVTDPDLRRQVDAFNDRFRGRLVGVYDWDGSRMMQNWEDYRKKKE